MTFEEYLKDYVAEMSDLKAGASLEEYANETKKNPRLAKVLIYYAAVSKKSLIGTCLETEYKEILREVQNNEPLPMEYEKIRASYNAFLIRNENSSCYKKNNRVNK